MVFSAVQADSANGTTERFSKTRLFISGWTFFRFSTGKFSGSDLKKITFLLALIVIFTEILELGVLLTSSSANLMFSEDVLIIRFLYVHQSHPAPYFFSI